MKACTHHTPSPRPNALRQTRACLCAVVPGLARAFLILALSAACRLSASDASSSNLLDTTGSITKGQVQTGAGRPARASNPPIENAVVGMDLLDDKHPLAIGDQISFRIVEDEEDPKPLTITDSGELEVPYIGRLRVVGKTCKQLAAQLKAELEKEYYYQATVIIAVNVMAKSRGRVYLVGPVHTPGPQEIPSDEVLTLSKAILRAGGFTDFADGKHVKVTRLAKSAGDKDEIFMVNVVKVLEKGSTESDLPLAPGDLVYVPERVIHF